jgi:hypothetical protein
VKPLSWGAIDAALGLDVPTREEREARIDRPRMAVERAEGGHGTGRRRGRTKVRRTIKLSRAMRY